MLTIATLLWDANSGSQSFSRAYTEEWVERLYRGFERNLSDPFRFVCHVDRLRKFGEPIEQREMEGGPFGYADCIRAFEGDEPKIVVGLDTVITGNCDHLARYCMTENTLALPRDPYKRHRACTGVALVPAGMGRIYTDHAGQNDMDWLRSFPHRFIDDIWPGHVQSFKGDVKRKGLGDTRIVYFHGLEKPHELSPGHPILRHWV